jgi:hypothetical protein
MSDKSPSTRRAIRPAAAKPASDFNAFVNAVMEPLPDETLLDTHYNLVMRRARHEAWHQADTTTRYCKALFDVCWATSSYYEYVEKNEIAARRVDGAHAALLSAYRTALARQILTPAYHRANVAWKRRQDVDYLPIKREEVEAAIAADEAFLAAHPTRRARAKVGAMLASPEPELDDFDAAAGNA